MHVCFLLFCHGWFLYWCCTLVVCVAEVSRVLTHFTTCLGYAIIMNLSRYEEFEKMKLINLAAKQLCFLAASIF